MTPRFFARLIRNADRQGVQAPTLAFALIHQQIKAGKRLAFYCPPAAAFAEFVLFSDALTPLSEVVGTLSQHPALPTHYQAPIIDEVPSGWEQGRCVALHRYRLHGKGNHQGNEKARQREIGEMARARLPYFILFSQSTRQRFSLVIEHCFADAPALGEGRLDGFGLSNRQAPVWLPMMRA